MNRLRVRERSRWLGGASIMDTAGVYGRQHKVIGDSRFAGSSTSNTSSKYNEANGTIAWVMATTNGCAFFEPDGNFGVSQDTTDDVLARMTPILDHVAHNAHVLIGRNDRSTMTLQESKDNLDSIISQLHATSATHPNGHRVYLYDELPDENFSGATLTDHIAYRDWIRAKTQSANLIIVRSWNTVADVTDGTSFQPGLTTEYGDEGASGTGTHPNVKGHALISAAPAAKVIATTMPRTEALLATDSATGVLNANYALAGTSGTNTGVTSGSLATGLVAQSQSATGLALVWSKEVDSNGKNWQVATLSGSVPTTNNALIWAYDSVLQNVTDYLLSAGDYYYGACEIQYSGLVNVASVGLECATAGVTRKSRSLDAYDFSRLFPTDSDGIQIHRTPKCEFPTSATTTRLQLLMAFGKGTTSSKTLTITRSGSTATATSSGHGFLVGSVIYIQGATQPEYNGLQTVLTVPTTSTFTFAVTGTPATPATGTITTGNYITRSGSTATFTSATDHRLITGESAVITGATETDYNGTFTITRLNNTQFTYTVANSPSTPATGTPVINYPVSGVIKFANFTARKAT